ncbi:hypothetical protein ACIBKY_24220 [Nonomuraea sp. NPDC050394]|uniref:hypothetical protein n=1 Tax=Nonomuraea sp. NPDC050394 TaxID=3364363 RepID=UPI0037B3F990
MDRIVTVRLDRTVLTCHALLEDHAVLEDRVTTRSSCMKIARLKIVLLEDRVVLGDRAVP